MQKKKYLLDISACPNQLEMIPNFKPVDRATVLSIKCVIGNERSCEDSPSPHSYGINANVVGVW